MNSKLKFAIVGAGRISQSYADAFERSTETELIAVADTNLDAARAFGERLHCRSYNSYMEIPDGDRLDAVVICTPPATHEEIALYFLRRGVHVLCEKPLSISSESALRMTDAAAEANVLLTMASKFRFVADVVAAHSLIASGLIGEVVLFENAFTSRVAMRERWNSDPRMSGGGVLIDNGTHSVDICRYFLGPLAHVQALEGKRSQNLAVEETVRVSARSMSGVLAEIDLSWSIDKELPGYINIYGADGTISVGWRESKYRLASQHGWTTFGTGYDKVQAFGAQIANFCAAIRGEEELVVAPADALASVEVIEAAYAALGGDLWTPINYACEFRIQSSQPLLEMIG